MPTNQKSRFEAQSASKSKKVKRLDINENINKLGVPTEMVAYYIIQSTTAMIEASHSTTETITNIIREFFPNPNPYEDYDVWGMLMDLGPSQPFMTDDYMFLIKDSNMLEGFIVFQSEHRKSLLLRLIGHNQKPQN